MSCRAGDCKLSSSLLYLLSVGQLIDTFDKASPCVFYKLDDAIRTTDRSAGEGGEKVEKGAQHTALWHTSDRMIVLEGILVRKSSSQLKRVLRPSNLVITGFSAR